MSKKEDRDNLEKYLDKMIDDEEKGIQEYSELANSLHQAGAPKSAYTAIMGIAREEAKHAKILERILDKYF